MKNLITTLIQTAVALILLVSAGHSDDSTKQKIEMKKVSDEKTGVKSPSATSTYTLFDYNLTTAVTSGMQPMVGCGCWPSESQSPQDIAVSPEGGITAHVGQPVELRYDGSRVCHRQGIWDMSGKVHKPVDQIGDLNLGSIQWEIGSVWQLPLEWGIVTYSGYSQVGFQTVTFTIKLQCHDDFKNCTHTCVRTKTLTVHVIP
jgi:hypothetical protein